MSKLIIHPGEKIISQWNSTVWLLLPKIAIALVLVFIPWSFITRFDLVDYRLYVLWWTVLVLLWFSYEYTMWYLEHYVLTTERLIQFHYHTMFMKHVVETPLERILNVSFKTTGFLSSVAKFGTVNVQIVGMADPLQLHSIRNPEEVTEQLWEAHRERLRNGNISLPVVGLERGKTTIHTTHQGH